MMPIWGAVSTKFAVKAGLLVISARIDLQPIKAIVDPSQPVTIVGETAARRLAIPFIPDQQQTVTRSRDIGIDHSTRRLRQVVTGRVDGGDVVIGSDLLRRMSVLFDFAKHRLRVAATAREAARLEKGMVAIPARITPDGCLGLTGTGTGGTVTVALVGGSDAAATGRIELGKVAVDASSDIGRCNASRMAIRWQDLGARSIVLDLANDKVWIKP